MSKIPPELPAYRRSHLSLQNTGQTETFCYNLHLKSEEQTTEDNTMLEVSEMAREKLLEHLKSSGASMAVRVTVTAG